MATTALDIILRAHDEASAVLRRAGDNIQGSLKGAEDASQDFAKGLTAIGVAAAAAGTFAVMSAADYEQALNIFRSVSGATADQMQQVAETARALGRDITLPGVSAKDAALAMVELAKAGLSVNDTLAASQGVLSLAKAGQLDTAQAAEIAANALNAFNLQGSQATRVADLLAAAANASSAGVGDLAVGMQMSSASAASMKVPLDDLVTMLAQMANNGIRGSDAGTSLKTMLASLTPSTKEAAETMQAMGLDFFNANGTFIGMRATIQQLERSTRRMTDEQRMMTLETIFGSDAIRAATILTKEGVTGFDALSGAVNKQGAASQLAAAQNAGFKGALDAFRSSVETLAIDLGTHLLPVLTTFFTIINQNSDGLGQGVVNFIQWTIRNGPLLAGIIIGGLTPSFFGFAASIGASVIALGPFLIAGAAAAVTAQAIMNNWAPLSNVIYQNRNAIEAVATVIGFALLPQLIATATRLTINTALWLVHNLQAIGGAIAQSYMFITSGWQMVGVLIAQGVQLAIATTRWLAHNVATGAAFVLSGRLTAGFLASRAAMLAGATATGLMTAAQWALNVAMSANPIGLIIIGIAALSAGLIVASGRWEGFRNSAIGAIKPVIDWVSNLVGWMGRISGLGGAVEGIRGVGRQLRIPGFAHGTNFAPGGLSIVGERGPELVSLPTGSRVHTNQQTREMLDSGGVTINVNGPTFRQDADLSGFARELAWRIS